MFEDGRSKKGIFMSELSNRIKAENLNIPMLGIKDTDNVFEQVKSFIKSNLVKE